MTTTPDSDAAMPTEDADVRASLIPPAPPTPATPLAGLNGSMILLGGLSLAIGWGIRGNFGHEYGAMIAGALAAMAVVLVSGRDDWIRRAPFFAFFGALGWSFGGTISYMQVIAYTHCGHLPSQVYGFACLFAIGFLWGGMGGVGTALPACMDRKRLTELIPPIIAVFIAWTGQDIAMLWLGADEGAYRHEDWFYWFDTDWVAALLAIEAVLVYAAIRGRICLGTSLVLYCAAGWWAAFFLLVVKLDLHMTPPRGDSWAGALGMTVGVFLFCARHRLLPALLAGLVAGFIGGFGFATAQAIKLVGYYSGWVTNWHSVLEQTYGLINGIGIAVAMGMLACRTESVRNGRLFLRDKTERRTASESMAAVAGVLVTLAGAVVAVIGLAGCLYHMGLKARLDPHVTGLHGLVDETLGDPTWRKFLLWLGVHSVGLIVSAFGRAVVRSTRPLVEIFESPEQGLAVRRWTEAFCVGLIMIAVTYVNLVKNVETWNKFGAMGEYLYGLHAYWWFSIGYGLALIAFVILAVVHLRRPLAVIPERPLGRGQMLYLAFLWVMVIGNLMRAIPPFHQQRLITEGVIIVSAILCTVFVLLLTGPTRTPPEIGVSRYGGLLGKTLGIGLLGLALSLAAQTGLARALYKDQPAPGAGHHVRFGPDATAKGEPEAGKPHP